MTDTPIVDKAAAAAGAGPDDLDNKTGLEGAPKAPPAPSNTPPVDEAAKAKAEADAAAKAAEEEAAKKAAADDAKPLDTTLWGSTGSEVGDSVLALLQNSGMQPTDAKALLYDAVTAGDPTKIDRDALIEKVGKDKATLILAGVENFVTQSKATAQTILTVVHESVGGEQNWTTVREWAKANIPEAERNEYADLIDAGGAKARFAAQELANRYNADTKNTTLTTPKTTEIIGDSKAQPTTRATTRAQYVAELEAAHKRGAKPAEIAEINSARAAGRAKNI
jgi:hypothetical protein